MEGFGLCLILCAVSGLAYCYVMARYEEFMTNREIVDAVIVKPACAVGNFIANAAEWAFGFLYGPVDLMFEDNPGDDNFQNPFDAGRFAFRIVSCVGLCLTSIISGIGAAGFLFMAFKNWLGSW